MNIFKFRDQLIDENRSYVTEIGLRVARVGAQEGTGY